jgi:cytochrome c556
MVLGADFPEFVAADKRVHATAVSLSEAAKTQAPDATVNALNDLQIQCMSCHTFFRGRLPINAHNSDH